MLEELLKSGERENVEFKEALFIRIHLKPERRQHLASQMKFRLENGKGKAIYVIGVDDKGNVKGLSKLEFEETLTVLRAVAAENSARVTNVERFEVNGKTIGRLTIEKVCEGKVNLVVATAGHVDSGKSTLLGCLISGIRDDGAGKTRIFLDTLPHEIERGLSAELAYALYGFKNGKPVKLKNPLDKKERARIVEECDKLVSFIDTVGHEPWLRTTIRGLVGQSIDYGLLTVGIDSGVTRITKEHLGLLLAMDLPIIIALTKVDRFDEDRIQRVEENVEKLLKYIGKIPLRVKSEEDIALVVGRMENVVPIIRTSAITLKGYDLLDKLFLMLNPRKRELDKPFLMYIDKIYNIRGVGTVVSGTIVQGTLEAGSELLLGPNRHGKFLRIKAMSIETHYHPLSKAKAGFVVGVALRGVKHEEVERGMILCDPEVKPKAYRSFEAEILVLNHPTCIRNGYEPVVHIHTISEAVKLKCLDKEYLKAGEFGRVRMKFKFKPHYISVGDKFVFREGKTKGIGTVLKVLES